MAKWTGKRVAVSFSKPNEPSFLKEFKKRVGYKEGPGVEDKFAELPPATAEDLADDDEDLPQVVTGGGRSALSAAELEALQQKGDLQQLLATGAAPGSANEGAGGSDQKIVFRKPASKRALEHKDDNEEEEEATVDDRSTAALKDKEKKHKKKKKKNETKTKKTLLSFDEDEDDK